MYVRKSTYSHHSNKRTHESEHQIVVLSNKLRSKYGKFRSVPTGKAKKKKTPTIQCWKLNKYSLPSLVADDVDADAASLGRCFNQLDPHDLYQNQITKWQYKIRTENYGEKKKLNEFYLKAKNTRFYC